MRHHWRLDSEWFGNRRQLSGDAADPAYYRDSYSSSKCDSHITVTDKLWAQLLISFNVSGREDAFKTGIRQRDGRCVISATRKYSNKICS
ncbi:hypothetical protein BGX38DRAFT_1269585 [Terfezia claveryi]|nr:hypothetical protein BGX38DRAFT_1269585 [Terfezia claveryi]